MNELTSMRELRLQRVCARMDAERLQSQENVLLLHELIEDNMKI